MSTDLRILIWNEFINEQRDKRAHLIYPNGIHLALAENLGRDTALAIRTAILADFEHGLSEKALEETDVLIWWGHRAHEEVQEHVVARVHRAVLRGMGLIVLHSGHHSKIFRLLLGTSCCLRWREA
jgi:trehalose utilization protein